MVLVIAPEYCCLGNKIIEILFEFDETFDNGLDIFFDTSEHPHGSGDIIF